MTTATTTSPLETYQQGRDSFLAVVLDAVSGLETSVLEFQHQHEGQVRSAGSFLSEALREKARLEGVVGEQALELEASRNHVCAVPESADFEADGLEIPGPAIVPETVVAAADSADDAETDRIIAGLRADLAAEQGIAAGLRTELAAEKTLTAELRGKLEQSTAEIDKLDGTLDTVEGKLRAAAEEHTRYVRETQATFDQRLAEGTRAAETGIRGEAVRIIEAIAADNPALAEAADLFTVAFPVEADPAEHPVEPSAPAPAPVAAPAVDFFDALPAPELAEAPAAPQPTAAPEWDETVAAPAPSAEDFYNALPAPEPEAEPAPMTQVLLPAPDLSDDAILDPNFFDNPVPLEAPVGEPVQAPAPVENQPEVPKPGYGLFGRKKEAQNV